MPFARRVGIAASEDSSSRRVGLDPSTPIAVFCIMRLASPGNPVPGEKRIGARNMHSSKRATRITGNWRQRQDRHNGNPRTVTKVVPNRKKTALQSEIRKHVLVGSSIFTDALKSYDRLDEFQHEVIDHAAAYVDGEVHTNGLENFWSLLKRTINGTYVSVEPFHLFRYVDEQAFRHNLRKGINDVDRFDLAVRQIVGKRLTFDQLTGKVEAQSQA
jgi:transposase-like protein